MRVLVGCEESGIVSAAFRRRGHEAYSCDLQGTRGDSQWHITGDVFRAIKKRGPWDLGIFFPPCTYVTVSGARWFKEPGRLEKQIAALEFMRDLLECNIPRVGMENPIGVFSTYWRKPDQIIQPWQFGYPETKATCIWVRNLPLLEPTNILPPPYHAKVHRMAPGPLRQRNRSETNPGIADAMSDQWGNA